MSKIDEDKKAPEMPWPVGWCQFTDDNPPPLQDGTRFKSASYRFSLTTDIHRLFEGAYAQVPESEARELLADRDKLKKARSVATDLMHLHDTWGLTLEIPDSTGLDKLCDSLSALRELIKI